MKPATWHWFALKGEGERPLFAFPGIWKRYIGPVRKNGDPVDIGVYSFLTTTPNPLVETINHERMPKADLPLLIYDQNRRLGGFVRALEIGCHRTP